MLFLNRRFTVAYKSCYSCAQGIVKVMDGFDDIYRFLTEKTYPKEWKRAKSVTSDERCMDIDIHEVTVCGYMFARGYRKVYTCMW